MSQLEKIILRHHIEPEPWWQRALDAVRSFTLGPHNPKDPAIARLYGGPPVSSGVSVNERAALTIAPFWCGVTMIAADIASLPLVLYRRLPNGGKERFTGHPLYRILHDQPNPEMSSMVFRETLLISALTWGNAFAEIERDAAGRPVAVWPLSPYQVTPYRDERKQLRYRVVGGDGGDIFFDAHDMIHLRGPSENGIAGFNVVQMAREALGLAKAAEIFGGTFFGQGSTFGGILTHPKQLTGKAPENLRQSLDLQHKGVERAHRFLILEEGMAYHKIAVDPKDSQLLEMRTFQIREVARFLKMPPSKLGDLADATFSNVEQENLSYFSSCLRPWLRRIEEEFDSKLISPLERTQQHCEHVVEGFLRADVEKRGVFYSQMASHGIMTVNEIRALENLPPIDGGDVARVPMNTEALKETA